MRKNKLLALMMSCSLLVSPMQVSANQTITLTNGVGSGVSDTEFAVTADMLGGGLVVTIPDSITLEYNAEDGTFEKDTGICAKGYIDVDKKLAVTVPTSISYKFESNEDIAVNGVVTFGIDGTENWSGDELKVRDDSSNLIGTSKNLGVAIDADYVTEDGDYNALVDFTIELVAEQERQDEKE